MCRRPRDQRREMQCVVAKKNHLPVQPWRWDSALRNSGQLFSSAASLRQKTHVPVPYNIGNNTSFLEIPVSWMKTYRKFNSIATRENGPRDLFPTPLGRKKAAKPRDFLQLLQ